MNLDSLTHALEQRGFRERETTKIVPNDMSRDGSTRWYRYILDEGDIQGSSVFFTAPRLGVVGNVVIVLSDIVQEMYFNALRQLEEATGMPYDSAGQLRSDYRTSCERLYKTLFLGFANLLERVGITPINIYQSAGLASDRPFELGLFMLDHPCDEKVLGENYRLSLMPTSGITRDLGFYMKLLDQLPDKLQALESEREKWGAFVTSTIKYARASRQFYQA